MKFEIKNRFNGSIIFSIETTSFSLCVEAAIKNSADLSYSDLRYSDLRSADLRSANLSYSDLSYSDLSYSDLSYANLSYSDLRSADLRYANLRSTNLNEIKNAGLIMAQLSICPTEGDFVGWKKLQNNVIARLVIPYDAQRLNSIGSRKCRASKAFVHEIFGATEAYDKYTGKLLYKTGQEVIPDKFDKSITSECSNGIHFFLSRIEAENY